MPGRAFTISAGLVGLIWAMVDPVPARGAEPTCSSVLVEADANLRQLWPELDARVRAAFEQRADVDTCAKVHLKLVDGSIGLAVTLPDGRFASRVVRSEDVIAGLEALLVVPKADPPPESQASPDVRTTTRFEPGTVEVHRGGNKPGADKGPAPGGADVPRNGFRVELSLGVGFHRGNGQTSGGVGAGSLLDAAGWLVGFSGRLDQYQVDPAGDGDAPKALEVGILAGRRFEMRSVSFDLVGGPALALRATGTSAMTRVASGGMLDTMTMVSSTQGVVPRMLLSGRFTLGARSNLRTFVGVDGEVGEAGPIPPGAIRGLPLWTAGVSLGATVGTL